MEPEPAGASPAGLQHEATAALRLRVAVADRVAGGGPRGVSAAVEVVVSVGAAEEDVVAVGTADGVVVASPVDGVVGLAPLDVVVTGLSVDRERPLVDGRGVEAVVAVAEVREHAARRAADWAIGGGRGD